MKRKIIKERQPRKDFSERFADKLRESGLGEVEEGSSGDDSGRWVELIVKDKTFCFSFDMKGEKIDRIGLYKDIIEVTGQEQIFSTT